MIAAGPVLVRVPSWLGDALAAEPALRALHGHLAAWGRAHELTLVAPRALLPVFEMSERAFEGARRLALEDGLRGWRGHRTAILLTGSFRSAWNAFRAGIPTRIGWSRDLRRVLLTTSVAPPLERGALPFGIGSAGRGRRLLPRPFGTSCVELLGLAGLCVQDTRPRLRPPAAATERVRARLGRAGIDPDAPFVLVNAGARPGSAKGYGAGSWQRVVLALREQPGWPCVLVGGPGEEVVVRASVPAASKSVQALVDPVLDLVELAALMGLARVVVTADTGPRHLARAVGAPTVCIFGPTDPRHTGEHDTPTIHLRDEVPCGPCHREICPLSGEEELCCMRAVEPERVAAAVRDLLAEPPASLSPAPRSLVRSRIRTNDPLRTDDLTHPSTP